MRIHSLQLIHFRSYEEDKFAFTPDIIVFYGQNGAGKTNILEAIYVATIGKSHRTNEDRELIQFAEAEAGILLHFEKKETPQRIQVKLSQAGRKELWLNQTKISRKELIGTLNTVIFSPEDLQLLKGSPRLRRRFIDIELSQTSAAYYQQLSLYNRALQQRNRILKEYAGKKQIPLDEWDTQLAKGGAFLIQKRLESLKKINLLANLMNRKITGGKENLMITYEQPYAKAEPLFTAEALREALHEALTVDRYRLTTSIGPHRDDLGFFSDTLDLKKFGSQGQQRTAILSLKLSELEFIKSEVGEYPILLLDDVLSELDKERRENLLAFIHKRVQTFITTTEIEEYMRKKDMQCILIGKEQTHGLS